MSDSSANALPCPEYQNPASTFSRVALVLALVLVSATFFLISPQPGKTYPGAIPWGEFSVLHSLTDLMSLQGLAVTARGVEIKDFAFHLAAVLGLVLVGARALALRSARDGGAPPMKRRLRYRSGNPVRSRWCSNPCHTVGTPPLMVT